MAQEVTYAVLDMSNPVMTGSSLAHPDPTEAVDYAVLGNVHTHPQCSRCYGLVDVAGRGLDQPKPSVAVAFVRRVETSTSFDPFDFEVLLRQVKSADTTMYELPESLLQLGEDLESATKRIARSVEAGVALQYSQVAFHGHAQRRAAHIASFLYIGLLPPPVDGEVDDFAEHFECYNLGRVTSTASYELLHDHGEMLNNVLGWLRQRFNTQFLKPMETKVQRVVRNPCFRDRRAMNLDVIPLAWRNPYFGTDKLRANTRDEPFDLDHSATISVNVDASEVASATGVAVETIVPP